MHIIIYMHPAGKGRGSLCIIIIHPLELLSFSLSFFTHFVHVHVFLDIKSLVIT